MPGPMKLPANFVIEAARLFTNMDEAFELAAGKAGFVCKGCEDNCCRTLFYHHTLMELLYLRSGLAAVPPVMQHRLKVRAAEVHRQMNALVRRGETARVMCPLNEKGRCVLYAHRPMICRLHGIPYELRRPDGRMPTGPGCDDYYIQCGHSNRVRLDRTPLYTAMADFERRLREQLGFIRKIKLTVAEMIINDRVEP